MRTALGCLCALAIAMPARATTIWEALPFAALIKPDLDALKDEPLRVRAEQLRQRLFIDEQTIAIERGEDLELVVGYAAAIALIDERAAGRAIEGLAGARRSAAYLLHATGFAGETRSDLRIAIAELGALDDPPARALATSVKAMRAYGYAAFEVAFAAGADPSATALAQAGRVALREDRRMLAAERFMAAAAKEPLPRFAVDACEALLKADEAGAHALCDRLEARFVATFPASAGRFAELRQRLADEIGTLRFRHGFEAAETVEALVAEAWRATRIGGRARVERLAFELAERYPSDPQAVHAAAEVTIAAGAFKSLATVIAKAEVAGLGADPRLLDARLAGGIAAALEVLFDATQRRRTPQTGIDQLEQLPGAIDRFVARGGSSEVARQLRVIAALCASADVDTKVDAALKALLAAPEPGIDSLTLALVVALLRDRWDADAAGVVARGSWAAKVAVTELYARVELGLGLRTRDRARLERAEALMAGSSGPAAQLARIVAARAKEVLVGGPIAVTGLDRDRRELSRIAFAFDETSPAGRLLAQARAFTLATLEAREDRVEPAAELLREARRFSGELGPYAAGVAQLLIGDAPGAEELCARGDAHEPALAQALLGCQALGAARPRPLWTRVEAHWDEAMLPPTLSPGTARPLYLTDLALAVRFEPGQPLGLTVRLEPVALLVPELLPSRVEVRERAGE